MREVRNERCSDELRGEKGREEEREETSKSKT